MSANWEAAKTKAKEIRNKYSLDDDRPVNAFDVASKEGIKVVYFKPLENTPIENASGLYVANRKTVYLNADEPADRQNFTLAHELAHYFLDHKPSEYGVSWRSYTYTNGSKPEKEQEADCFAAELLMPKKLIDKFKNKYDLNDNNVVTLAKLFGVSTAAMKYRILDVKNGRAT